MAPADKKRQTDRDKIQYSSHPIIIRIGACAATFFASQFNGQCKGSLVPISTDTPPMAAATECLFSVLTATSMYDEK